MHPGLARHVIFPLWQWKTGGRVLRILRDLEKSQWYAAERLAELQWVKLRILLHHAYRHVPYYRALFESLGMHPRDLRGPADYARLPALTKETVRDRAAELLADNARGPLVERRTSGSTGIPLAVSVYPATRDAWDAASLRVQGWWGLYVGARQLKFINPHGKQRRTLLKQYFLMNRGEFSVFRLDEAALERLYQRMRRSKCEVLAGYPSALTYFAQYIASRQGPHPRLRAVLSTAEVLFPDQRALLSRVFNCPVINEYGSSECGDLAGECPAGRLHVTAENALVEFDTGASINGAEPAWELLVTDLNNLAMPLLRYRIGDLGTLADEPCPCGRPLPVLRLRAGRTVDLVTLPDGRKADVAVFGEAVEELMRDGLAVRQFTAIQHTPAHIEVLIATDDRTHPAVARLPERLQAMLGARLDIVVRPVDRIPVERSGKLRRFISRLESASAEGSRP